MRSLMGRSSDGDEQRRALMEAIFREHFSAVHRYIIAKVGQPDVADDLTSMVFLKAFRWLLEDRGVKQVRSWLYATARTTIADYWQEEQQHPFSSLERIEDDPVAIFAPQHNEQVQTYVYHLLHLLSERERQVLILRYFQGYSTAEIGQALGLQVGHVRVLQLRALRHAALLETQERELTPMSKGTPEPLAVYTEQGQRVLVLAQEEALALHHYYIGTEHLLLGILREGSVAASLLAQGATPERVRAELLCVVGKNEPVSRTGTPLTPRSQRILTMAGALAGGYGASAIGPDHILQAVVREKGGLAVHILRSIGVTLDPWLSGEKLPSPQEEERYIQTLAEQIAQRPCLDEAEELRLVHLIARGKSEQRRAALLAEPPDAHLIVEGDAAYFQLIPACQHLVLAVAREYFGPGRNAREIIAAGNDGLSLAATSFGLNQQTPFRTYALHMIHIQIIRILG